MGTKIFDEQVKKYGLVKEAVRETIRICRDRQIKKHIHVCRDRNVLKKYLEGRESEVVDIMITLFSQEEIWDMHVRSKEKQVAEKATVETMKAAAKKMLRKGMLKVGEVAEFFPDLSGEDVEEIEGEMLERV